MNDLKCSVSACISNCGERCSRGEIRVAGRGARESGETRCASYTKSSGAFVNSLYGSAETETEVRCDAKTCTHNDAGRCRAERVSVAVGRGGTECGTFRPRKD